MLPTKFNGCLSRLGLGGAYHSGIQVGGTEYAYGGHPDDDTGIMELRRPLFELRGEAEEAAREGRDEDGSAAAALAWMPTLHSRSVIGWWMGPLADLEPLLRCMARDHGWVGPAYRLLSFNCNHFARALCGALLSCEAFKPAPGRARAEDCVPARVTRLTGCALGCCGALAPGWVRRLDRPLPLAPYALNIFQGHPRSIAAEMPAWFRWQHHRPVVPVAASADYSTAAGQGVGTDVGDLSRPAAMAAQAAQERLATAALKSPRTARSTAGSHSYTAPKRQAAPRRERRGTDHEMRSPVRISFASECIVSRRAPSGAQAAMPTAAGATAAAAALEQRTADSGGALLSRTSSACSTDGYGAACGASVTSQRSRKSNVYNYGGARDGLHRQDGQQGSASSPVSPLATQHQQPALPMPPPSHLAPHAAARVPPASFHSPPPAPLTSSGGATSASTAVPARASMRTTAGSSATRNGGAGGGGGSCKVFPDPRAAVPPLDLPSPSACSPTMAGEPRFSGLFSSPRVGAEPAASLLGSNPGAVHAAAGCNTPASAASTGVERLRVLGGSSAAALTDSASEQQPGHAALPRSRAQSHTACAPHRHPFLPAAGFTCLEKQGVKEPEPASSPGATASTVPVQLASPSTAGNAGSGAAPEAHAPGNVPSRLLSAPQLKGPSQTTIPAIAGVGVVGAVASAPHEEVLTAGDPPRPWSVLSGGFVDLLFNRGASQNIGTEPPPGLPPPGSSPSQSSTAGSGLGPVLRGGSLRALGEAAGLQAALHPAAQGEPRPAVRAGGGGAPSALAARVCSPPRGAAAALHQKQQQQQQQQMGEGGVARAALLRGAAAEGSAACPPSPAARYEIMEAVVQCVSKRHSAGEPVRSGSSSARSGRGSPEGVRVG